MVPGLHVTQDLASDVASYNPEQSSPVPESQLQFIICAESCVFTEYVVINHDFRSSDPSR
jgi:hypothetical protein